MLNRTEFTARMRGGVTRQGEGAKASCNVNRGRKAYYFIPFHMMVQFVPISQNAAITGRCYCKLHIV